jgi:hypothetical protein
MNDQAITRRAVELVNQHREQRTTPLVHLISSDRLQAYGFCGVFALYHCFTEATVMERGTGYTVHRSQPDFPPTCPDCLKVEATIKTIPNPSFGINR